MSAINMFVQRVGGNKHSVVIRPTDTIRELKEKISGRTNISPENQRLIYAGNELPNSGRVGGCNLMYGTTIFVKDMEHGNNVRDPMPQNNTEAIRLEWLNPSSTTAILLVVAIAIYTFGVISPRM